MAKLHSPQTAVARRLRRTGTDVENQLWFHLRSRQVAGRKFRRQEPIGPYFVDFCCVEEKLVVELDGGQHAERREQDRQRTAYLAKCGYLVLRFWNYDLSENLEAVVARIGQAVSRRHEDKAR